MMERMLMTGVLSGTATNVLLVNLQKRLVLAIIIFLLLCSRMMKLCIIALLVCIFVHRDKEGLGNLFNLHFVIKVSKKKLVHASS